MTEHFSIEEFEYTNHKIPNKMPPDVIKRAKLLCEKVLEPLRTKFGPIKITSGFRSPLLNKKVGGVMSSQHLLGEAADIQFIDKSVTLTDVFKYLITNELIFDQCIHEFRTMKKAEWIHISYTERRINRQESFIQKKL